MKKWLLIILSTILLFSVKNCYANDSNIKVDTYRNENFVVEFSIGDEKVYGFTTTLEYDSNKFKLSNCTAHNGYEISTYQNNIVVESITAKKNVKAATCYFEILDTKETSLAIKNINTGNYNEVSAEKDMQLKVLGNKTPTQVENIPDTAEGIGMGYIFFGCTLTLCGGVIIFLLFNKKYGILCSIVIALCLAIPGRVDAAKDKINLSEEDLSGARNILLGKEESNLDYDFDGDEKITINDLVITKVDLSRLQVSFISSGSHGKTSYYNLSMKYKIDSSSQLENVEFCVKSVDQACNYQKVNKTFTSSYVSELRTFGAIGNTKQQMCVKTTNKEGLTRNVCSNGYLVDPTRPSITSSSESSEVTGCYTVSTLMKNRYKAYFTPSYGFSGGDLELNSVYKASAVPGLEYYNVNVRAVGNNGSFINYSRSIKCKKKVTFVGDNLSLDSIGLRSISLSPAVADTTYLGSKRPYSSINTTINSLPDTFDKVIITTGYLERYNNNINAAISAISTVGTSAKKKFGDKAIFLLIGNNSDSFITKARQKLSSVGVRYIDCGSGTSCYSSIAAAGGFSGNFYLNNEGVKVLQSVILNYI